MAANSALQPTRLSVIVIAHNMARNRTLTSLSRDYQLKAAELGYEVILIDNGLPSHSTLLHGLTLMPR